MIFSCDLRHRLCKLDREWIELVNLRSEIKCISDREDENPKIVEDLKTIIKILDESIDVKAEEMRKETKQFEKDFVQDVLENEGLYRELRLKEEA